jgi:predicted MFS family arabinose efflux permease
MAQAGLTAIRSAFRNRNYRLYIMGNIPSHFGSWIQRVAMGWLAWELTKSGFWLGVVAVAELAPAMVLAPFAGAVADRVNRLTGLKVSQSLAMCQALALCVVAAMDPTIEWLVGLALARGIIISFNQPFRFSILPSLVERKDLSAAVGINSLSFNSARVVGPAVAALIIQLWGASAAFAFNAASFFIFIMILFVVKIDLPPRREPKPISNIPAEVLEGILYCLRAPGIAQMFVLLTVVALCGRAYVELLPGFADGVFNRGVEGLGIMHAAAGVGAIIGSVLLARRGTVIGLTRIVSWMLLVLGVALLLFASTSNFWFAVVCVGVTGFATVVVGVGEQQLLQNAVSSDLRGRVMSIYGMLSRGAPAIGAFAMGTASSFFGLQWPVAVGGIVCLALCIWALRCSRKFAPALEGEPDHYRSAISA